MPDRTVFVFGAGATKACGGPLTNEILPEAFKILDSFPGFEREGFLELVNEYLVERYHIPADITARKKEDYPQLPRLLAMLDAAIERDRSLGAQWTPDRLQIVRSGLEFLIFALLQHKLQRLSANHYYSLLKLCGSDPVMVSLNYDIIVDNAFCRWAEDEVGGAFPDYGTEISTNAYQTIPKVGTLLKLHGSLNWYFCPGCQRLFVGINDSGRGEGGRFYKVLEILYVEDPLEPRYSCSGSACRECGAAVKPILITPSHQRDYENPHIARIWETANDVLEQADQVVIVGYSLPAEDTYVNLLLNHGLAHLDPSSITVVDYDEDMRELKDHPVGQQYRALFGANVNWHPEGFAAWIAAQEAAGTKF